MVEEDLASHYQVLEELGSKYNGGCQYKPLI